jgi:hypothetical protein
VINQEEAPFDYQSFCTLGCANDRRGGDSCGVFIDGKVEYGIGQKAKFEDFFWTSELLNTTERARIALGHDRKASVGGISLEKAHPIVISEPVEVAEGEESREEVKFVMVHNGTIYNYEELAKKYIPDVDIKDMSDSQVIARIAYYAGYDFLAEYNGGAAFIAVDYRKGEPEIILWRGESKRYSVGQPEEERPLYCNLKNGRLVVSSIPSYLAIVDGNCYTVPANTILTYSKNTLWINQKIDRKDAQQNKKYEYGTYGGTNYGGNNTGNSSVSKYLKIIDSNNTYKCGNDLIDGYVRVTSFGKILTKFDSFSQTERMYQIWFFNGIPLFEKQAYVFLMKAWKRTKLSVVEFTSKYQNLIRYLSSDQLFFIGSNLFEATGPFEKKIFTGYHQMLTNAQASYYNNGFCTAGMKVGTVYDGFNVFGEQRKYDYRSIWKEFIQSME